ncbi:MAG: Rpn family recombination-promoting nuclease/putative transposase [Candidatus Sericytochromatia bacterium]|nr:Rpn family recombination-promoting nuclease/putative transposase [Candidatus Sericytochromatia bacterium]
MLDNEFKTLFPESESEERRVDKLVEVKLKNGDNKWILLHIEIQSYEDKDFSKRMYHYYSRIFDKYDKEIEAIAVFTYQSDRHKYSKYESKFVNTKITYEYQIYDLAKQNIRELEKSKNPFSFIIQTLMKAFEYEESDENNFNFKKELSRLLLSSGYDKKEIERLFRFINFVFEIKNKNLRRVFYKEVAEMALRTETDYGLTDYEMAAVEIAVEKNIDKIAKNLKNKGFSLIDISEATGLTKEEIEKL